MKNQEKRQRIVTKTSIMRWNQAQQWELNHWRKLDERASQKKGGIRGLLQLIPGNPQQRLKLNDWNDWWFEQFDQYSFLPRKMKKLIELGSGPYTNARLISQECDIEQVVCTDPLALEYTNFDNGWLANSFRTRRIMVVCHPMESSPFPDRLFDCVIVINVLDHVHNAEACLKEAIRLTCDRGILILGQDLTNEEDMEKPENMFDIGHPIRLKHDWLDRILLNEFESLIYKILSREQGRDPNYHYGTYIFAGRRIS